MKKKLFAALLAAALLSLLVPAFATPSVGDLIRFCPTEIEVNYSSVLVKGYFVNLNTDYAVRNFRDFQMDVYKSGNKIVSGTFGTLLAELFAYREDVWEQTLRRMGFFLGKFIYILDAYDDLEEDRKNGAYNPLLAKSTEEGFDDWCRRILTMMMAECCSAFEMLPIVTNIEILRNILYAGVWTKYDAVRAAREGKNASEIAAQAAADGDSEGGADGTDSAAADSGAVAESSAADSGAVAESAAATDSDAAAEGSRQ